MKRFILVASALLCLCAAAPVFGQTVSTRITGTVKDSQDAVVPGVKVTVIDVGTKKEHTTTTNDDGAFVVSDVRPGNYIVEAERSGFKKLQVRDVVVHVDVPVNLNMTLETGDVAATVSVTASGTESLIRTEDAKLSTTIDVKQVQDLPLNGRNPITIAGGMAGVATNTNVRGAVINGLRGSFSNITWDGIQVNDNLVRTDALFAVNTPSAAGVSEFTLTTQNAGPDEGLGIAQVKFTTTRGTKDYHGEVYDYYRNSKFDANTFFNNATRLAKPELLQHQYGFNVGGPFALPRPGEGGASLTEKKKLFFYFFYEKTNTTQDFTPNRTVLTAAARTGTFTYLRTDNGATQTVNLLTLTGRTVDARIAQLIALTPAGNNTSIGDTRNTEGFRFNTPNGSTGRNIGFRLDYDINSKNRVEGVYSHFLSVLPNDVQLNDIGEPFPGLPGGGQQSSRPRYAIAWISNFMSNVTNEIRFGFSSSTPLFFNREDFSEGYRLGLPLITNPIQSFLQQGRAPRNHDLIDNLTWVAGNHVLKFGTNYRRVRILNFNDGGTIHQYTVNFNSSTNPSPLVAGNFPGGISSTQLGTASSLLGLLTGAVSADAETFNVADRTSGFTRGLGSRRFLDYDTLAFYGGDTWRFRENLSLNLGLRWEYIGPLTERNGLGLLPKDTSLAALNDPNAILDYAGAGTSRPFVAKDMNNWAPNFSFAWDPFKSGKTSVRGGFAVSYAIDNNATVLNNAAIAGNAGLSSTNTVATLRGTVSGLKENCTGTPVVCVPYTVAPTPVFKVPRTLIDQLTLSTSPTIFTTEFNLATPYAAQWNFGIEREITNDTALSVGYVGNRGVQLTRGIDTNQVLIFQNGFLADFQRAYANCIAQGATLAGAGAPLDKCTDARFNPAVPGSQALTIFPRLNTGGNLTNAAVLNLIRQGQVGELAATYASARTTYLNTSQPCNQATQPAAGAGTICPSFFLPANGNAFVTDYIGSSGWSSYHGLQAEVRKRLTHGWYYQVNYTWSKAFTNAEQAQAEFLPYLDNTIGDALEKKRLNQNVAHILNGNFVYELPFGPGKRFLTSSGAAGKIFGGWRISGLGQIRSGRPISFISGRGTLNRSARSGNNTPNTTMTISQLQSNVGLFYSPTTGLPLLVNPTLIAADGRAAASAFTHPTAGSYGNLSLTPVDGPGYWNVDMSLIKKMTFKERLGVELRLDAFNVFNHTNFSVPNSLSIDDTNFSKINSAFDPRILQLSWKFTF
ncbi:MAG: outer membrane beta-barrel protein [Pyrinomonadaceae bacterium]